MVTEQSPRTEPTWLTILRLLRWHKPAGRLILMIPALWAVVLAARGMPPLLLVGIIVLGTLATSAAGCVVNDLWDKDIDPQVQRTRTRPLASRALTVQTGIVVLLVSLLCAYGLSRFLNPLSFWLCVAAVPVILLYPAAKRVFPVPQLVLAIAWGFAVLISWTAVTGYLEPATFWLWGATITWTLGFDTVYAMADREDDRRIGVNSSALFFGKHVTLAVGIFFAATALLLAVEGVVLSLNWVYGVTVGVAAIAWIRETWQLSFKQPPPKLYGKIFGENVWLGFILLLGMVLGNLF